MRNTEKEVKKEEMAWYRRYPPSSLSVGSLFGSGPTAPQSTVPTLRSLSVPATGFRDPVGAIVFRLLEVERFLLTNRIMRQ